MNFGQGAPNSECSFLSAGSSLSSSCLFMSAPYSFPLSTSITGKLLELNANSITCSLSVPLNMAADIRCPEILLAT